MFVIIVDQQDVCHYLQRKLIYYSKTVAQTSSQAVTSTLKDYIQNCDNGDCSVLENLNFLHHYSPVRTSLKIATVCVHVCVYVRDAIGLLQK